MITQILFTQHNASFNRVLFYILCLFLSACEGNVEPVEALRTAPIVNGTATGFQEWQGAVLVETVYVRCTGTLIHPEVVLTAAHCIVQAPDGSSFGYDLSKRPDQIRIAGGPDGTEVLSGIEEIVLHPSWAGEFSFDVPDLAMLRLSEPQSDLPAYRLRDYPLPKVGDTGIIVGYGVDPTDTETAGLLHRKGDTEILSLLPYYLEIGGETNTCTGDSGGPLFTLQDDEWVLTGVTSFGPSDCPVDAEGYDVSLLAFCAWLNDTFTALTGESLGLSECTSCTEAPPDAWGMPCGPGYGCCPAGTSCRTPDDFSTDGLGWCAPSCCSPGETDAAVCTDIAGGEEACDFTDEYGQSYCSVRCTSDKECPNGTTCENKPFASDRVCIASVAGDGPSCTETDTGDTESTDSDSPDSDSPDSESGTTATAAADCSCRIAGIKGAGVLDFMLLEIDL